MGSVDAKLQGLGITLPSPAAPVANYVAFVRTGNLVDHLRPALPGPGRQARRDPQGQARRGDFPRGGTAGRAAVRHQPARAAQGRHRRSRQCRALRAARRLHQCRPDLRGLAPVMNGASDLMVEVLGDKGRHARSTIGVAELPLDAASRSKGCSRSDERSCLARREADRSSRPARQGRRHHREHALRRRGGHRARLRDRMRRSADRRRRGRGVPRFRPRPPDGGAGQGGGSQARGPDDHRRSRVPRPTGSRP